MVKTDQKENFYLVIFDQQPLLQVHPKLSKKLQYSVGDFEALFAHILTKNLIEDSSDQSHFIFEINVGKTRIRHTTILKWNDKLTSAVCSCLTVFIAFQRVCRNICSSLTLLVYWETMESARETNWYRSSSVFASVSASESRD